MIICLVGFSLCGLHLQLDNGTLLHFGEPLKMPAAYLVIINLMWQKYNSDAAEFFYDINI